MSVLYIMLPAALAIAAAAVIAFVRAAQSGQYDDLDTPPYRVLLDDDMAFERPAPEPEPRPH